MLGTRHSISLSSECNATSSTPCVFPPLAAYAFVYTYSGVYTFGGTSAHTRHSTLTGTRDSHSNAPHRTPVFIQFCYDYESETTFVLLVSACVSVSACVCVCVRFRAWSQRRSLHLRACFSSHSNRTDIRRWSANFVCDIRVECARVCLAQNYITTSVVYGGVLLAIGLADLHDLHRNARARALRGHPLGGKNFARSGNWTY